MLWSLLTLLQVVLCNEPTEMFDYISEDQITTDVGGQLEFDANEWTQHKSVCPYVSHRTWDIYTYIYKKKKENRKIREKRKMIHPTFKPSLNNWL